MKDVISIQTLTKYIRVLKILSSVRFSIISLPLTVHSQISTPENVINDSPLYSFLVRKEALSQRSE